MSEGSLRRAVGVCGIAGPILLTIYFGAPAVLGWPFAGAPAAELASYAKANATLFYAGASFQAVGTLLSVTFFVGLVVVAGATSRLAGLMTIVASTALFALVLAETVFMVAVPAAAAAGDLATVATAFALSNGVFARVFPIGPAPATYLALGTMLRGTGMLPGAFAGAALGLAVVLAVAGVVAIFTPAGLIAAIVLSVVQEIWIVAAAIALLRAK